MKSKTLAAADSNGNIYYEYTDEGVYGTDDSGTSVDERYGYMSKSKRSSADSDGCRSFEYSYYADGNICKKTCYSDSDWTTTKVTYWYYDESGRIGKKLTSSGEAAVYFDEGQTGSSDYYSETYWSASGTVTHWASVEDYQTANSYKCEWYYNGSDSIEVYTYYESGRCQYIDVYTLVDGVWTWTSASKYSDKGGDVANGVLNWAYYAGSATRAETGASSTFALPDKPEASDGGLASIVANNAATSAKAAESSKSSYSDDQTIVDGMLAINAMKSAQFRPDANYSYSGELATKSPEVNELKNNLGNQ